MILPPTTTEILSMLFVYCPKRMTVDGGNDPTKDTRKPVHPQGRCR